VEARVQMAMLYDFYGSLLTVKQRQVMELYFDEDLSLGEIAAEFSVSRQAVYDTLNRAEAALKSYEDCLGLLKKHRERVTWRARIEKLLLALAKTDTTPEQRKLIVEILKLLDSKTPGGD